MPLVVGIVDESVGDLITVRDEALKHHCQIHIRNAPLAK
jgi:hypothetical protein